MKKLLSFIKNLIISNLGILFALVVALVALAVLTVYVILPAYQDPNNKMYSSSLGQPALLRRAGDPLPVRVEAVSENQTERKIMGEGVCASQPILVPIIPMALVKELHVQEGQVVRKGDLLVTLDDTKAQIKYESAQLALSTAKAEQQRVKLGSAYVLAQERPEVEKVNLSSLTKQEQLAADKLAKYQAAFDRGVIAEVALLAVKTEFAIATEQLEKGELAMEMAEKGVKESLKIAQNAMDDATQAVAHRKAELDDFKVFAPADGVIDRVLIQEGEYNQDSGKPGFLISSGLWFEAYFDQAEFAHVKKGQTATLALESFPGRDFQATVTMVKPVVSFNSGGPEIARPLRPRGTGSPEWAATFKVRLEVDAADGLVPGMTGFARLQQSEESLTVPRSAVTSVSAGSALVYVVGDEDEWETREVKIGQVGQEHVVVMGGLALGEKVMVEGHWNLQTDDEIEVHSD
jgi:HlyD family secretion protein